MRLGGESIWFWLALPAMLGFLLLGTGTMLGFVMLLGFFSEGWHWGAGLGGAYLFFTPFIVFAVEHFERNRLAQGERASTENQS